ncbi:acyl CoA:acetate/3-ketoacid CoA transferase [Ammoniphilus resinae]|uniref:acyl CoA:acetate/3-ketoacid CoA transferase n=1 Tax=Ammoniphilus resinae TaxID=861532 RepID=UPI001AE5D787
MDQISMKEAAYKIKSGQTITVSGNGEFLNPDGVLAALEKRFLETGEPKDLTLIYNVIPGSPRRGTGVDRLAHPGMLKRIYAGSYYTLEVEKLNDLIRENQVEAYLVPYGALYNMMRTASAGQPGVLTPVGIGTFVDPRIGGDKLTPRTTEDISQVMEIDGKEYLFYKAVPIDVAIIRATTADEDGNLSLEQEPFSIGILHKAMAAKNRGGTVIAQVKQIAKRGSIHPKSVAVPGIFVDHVVLAPDQMDAMPYNPAWTGDIRIPMEAIEPMPLDYKKVISRRAAMELEPGDLVNFGFGISASVPQIASEEGIADQVIFNVEHGPVGGIPNNKYAFGAGVNMMATMDAQNIFEFYDAGRLNMTCLGMAEVNRDGSINVSRVNGKYNLGGFMDIVHATKKIVFCGTFTAGGLDIQVEDGKIKIIRDGRYRKFVNNLQHVTFNGNFALEKVQKVVYVTERAVFTITEEGLTLTEIAPGVDLEQDILAKMEFRPAISKNLKEMDDCLFQPERMGLRQKESFARQLKDERGSSK